MRRLIQDARLGIRMLRKSPGFTAVALLTLAVGIGANVAIFSFVDELWLKPMPVPHPERVVRIFTSNPSIQGTVERGYSSFPDFEDLRASAKTLSGVAFLQRRGAMFDDGERNRLVTVALLSNNFFDVLAPGPVAGRTFSEGELQNAGAPVVLVSYSFWQRQFQGDPRVAGHNITVDHRAVTLLGVLPRSFHPMGAVAVQDLWMPISTWIALTGERSPLTNRSFRDYELFGRLQEGQSLQAARAELASIASRLEAAYPKSNHGARMTAMQESQTRDADMVHFAAALLGIAALVLLIACANVASLMLARGESRMKEMATRIALGAGRARIIGQLLVENALLAMIGTLAAVLVGKLLLDAIPKMMPALSFAVGVDAYLNWRGLVAAAAAAVLSLLFFGVAPAVTASQINSAEALKQQGARSGQARSRARDVLVVAQVALSLVMVVSSGLLVSSVIHGMQADPGFNAHQKMLVIELTWSARTAAGQMASAEEARRRLEAIQGIEATTIAMRVPFGMSGGCSHHGGKVPQRQLAALAGSDRHMADLLWPGQNAVGHLIRLERPDGDEYEVVGVVEDGKYNDLGETTMPYLFLPMRPADYGEIAMAVKTNTEPGAMAATVRKTLRELDKDVDILGMLSLREHVAQALYEQRLASRFVSALGTLGLFLAAVGIYGLMAFVVSRRTQEIGVRLALGAQRGSIFQLVVQRALLLTVIGVIMGALGALGSTRVLQSFLIGVEPTDLLVFSLGAGVLLAVAALAALVPALSATRVDPVTALRYE
jgi:ABC-type antimicrobial peptide transport system permease subunit